MKLPIGCLVGLLRDQAADETAAFSRVRESACRDAQLRTAPYDAFVEDAARVQEGLLIGLGVSAEGAEVPIRLPWDRERGHLFSIGSTGTGKTMWLSWLLEQRHRAGRPWGLVDLKGDSFALVSSWLADREASGRSAAVIFNPFGDALVPLNVCKRIPWWPAEVQAYDVTLALSRLFENDLSLHQANILRHLILLLAESDLTIAEAPLVLRDEVVRGVLVAQSKSDVVRDFFFRTYPELPTVSKDALLGRLDSLLLPEAMRLMLGADELCDFRGLLERGDPLVAFLGRGPGVPEEQVGIIGSLLFSLVVQAAYARGTGQRSGYFLAFDEFHNLADAPGMVRRFDSALATIRSYGVGLGLVCHAFSQLSPGLRDIALSNCDCIALFRTSSRNAEYLGDFLPEDVLEFNGGHSAETLYRETRRRQHEALQRLPNRELFWYDRRKPYRAVRVRVPELPEARPVTSSVPSSGAVPRAALREQLAARRARVTALAGGSGGPATPARKRKKPRRGSVELG